MTIYNSYPNGSEPWWATKEAKGCMDGLDDARDAIEGTFEEIIGQMDTAISDRDEMEEERDQIQRDHDDLKEKYETLHAATDMNELINEITKMKLAAEAVVTYTTNKLIDLGALNDVQESDTDSGPGTTVDGGG